MQLVEHLNNYGYVVIPSVFDDEFIKQARSIVDNNSLVARSQKGLTAKSPIIFDGDVLSQNSFDQIDFVLFHEKFIKVARGFFKNKPVYFGESNIHVGEGIRGFHKDNRFDSRNSLSSDYNDSYNILRFAIYLQDTDLYSGGIKLVPKSHKVPSSKFYFSGINVRARAGDVVVWKLTTSHSGNAVRLSLAPNLCVHPRIEHLIPKYLESVNPLERMSIFIVLSENDLHLQDYLKYYGQRSDNIEFLKNCIKPSEFVNLSHQLPISDILLVEPTDTYGENFSIQTRGT
jgi:hypothetical protein